MTELADGTLLVDLVNNDPIHWLGTEHFEAFGSDTMMLVKLLDAGQRLPVHVHPSRAFSSEHLERNHGKAEAWMILEGGTVHLGFNREVSTEELTTWVDTQSVAAFLGAMHAVTVSAGDSIFVPPGMPHAIGEGVFLVEIQEPEDLSILLEWDGFSIDGTQAGHLGLGFETALAAVDRQENSREDLERLIVRTGQGVKELAAGSRSYFRVETREVSQDTIFDPGFSIMVVTDGIGEIKSTQGTTMSISRGDTVLIAHDAGGLQVSGQLKLIRCRPPESRFRAASEPT
ncbi:class I mannose-6-phosphate isomerase [Arthrobacter psychrolactophilus]|uniref:class I mannose-6-phosphate isomerase n=1 Tax=Arthrobacter psychrolactophilus TaxID=92442 RepID=UPI001FEBC052|nr:class I mannose-6-phosphate isomerase [Arthrobacter psychrolactophilus]